MERIEFIFSFPRLYVTLDLFGREFYFNLGWFGTNVETWKFGPQLWVEKMVGSLSTEKFTLYNFQVGFNAFTKEFMLCLGTCRYYD